MDEKPTWENARKVHPWKENSLKGAKEKWRKREMALTVWSS